MNVDLVVVGGGILGTFHAYHAALMGKKVILTEKDQYPVSATVRNFGQIVPSGMTEQWLRYGQRSTEIYKSIQQEFDISVRQNGSVYVASDPDERLLLHELQALMDTQGYEAQLLSQAQTLSKYPALRADYCREALFFPNDMSAEPERLIYRIHEYMLGKFPNFTYRPHTAVIACEVVGSHVEVTTAQREVLVAEKVIVCNGGEFKLLFADLFRQSGIVVSKLQMLRTVPMPHIPLEGNILTGLTIRRYESFEACPSFSKIATPTHYQELKHWGIHLLFKKATDGSFIIGDSHEYADVNHTDDLGFELSQHINELMLQEAERIVNFDVRRLATAWAGFYPQHPDKDIVEIDLDDRIHIRTAIGGKGMTSSAGYAEKSIQQIWG
ncbi:MAG: TIGR03364 family FAD-dependent oxidoreductase [Spirosomataceae bacterium]